MRAMPTLGLMVLVIGLVILGSRLRSTSAAWFELTTPAVPFPAEYPQADRDRINDVLTSDKVTFAGGSCLDFSTTLGYRGDTEALNIFLGELVKCRDVSVHVSFERPGSASYLSELDWSIHHMAGKNHFHVIINLDSNRVDLTSLYLPDMSAPVE